MLTLLAVPVPALLVPDPTFALGVAVLLPTRTILVEGVEETMNGTTNGTNVGIADTLT